MRILAVLLAVVFVASSRGQDLEETHGKTNPQILAMGYERWYTFYTGKEGETTLGMSQATYKYAQALKWRNSRLLATLPAAKAKEFKVLGSAFNDFGSSAISVARALNGGGSIYQLVFSGDAKDVEEVLYALITNRFAKPLPMVVSDVEKEIRALEQAFRGSSADTWRYEFKREDVAKSLALVRSSWTKILNYAKKQDRRRSDLILKYCRDAIEKTRLD